VREILGSYGNFSEAMNEMEKQAQTEKKEEREAAEQKQVATSTKAKNKLSYKEKFELDQLNKEIPALEKEKKELEEKMNANLSNHEEIMLISARLGAVVSQLDEKGFRWLELSELEG
jgi:ATP-binding cassette subfamily F protein uup